MFRYILENSEEGNPDSVLKAVDGYKSSMINIGAEKAHILVD